MRRARLKRKGSDGQLSKNWRRLHGFVYSVRKFRRKDGGVTVQYWVFNPERANFSAWISERFEPDQKVILRYKKGDKI